MGFNVNYFEYNEVSYAEVCDAEGNVSVFNCAFATPERLSEARLPARSQPISDETFNNLRASYLAAAGVRDDSIMIRTWRAARRALVR